VGDAAPLHVGEELIASPAAFSAKASFFYLVDEQFELTIVDLGRTSSSNHRASGPSRGDDGVDSVGDELIPLPGGVLVAKRSLRTGVPHPVHEVLQAGARAGRDCVRGMAQVMEPKS
jgi:hypothetical protein